MSANPGKGIAGHGPGNSQPVVQVPITKITTFQNVQINIESTPDGGRILQIIDAGSGTVYALPLNGEVARDLGNKLFSAVPVAKPGEMPT